MEKECRPDQVVQGLEPDQGAADNKIVIIN